MIIFLRIIVTIIYSLFHCANECATERVPCVHINKAISILELVNALACLGAELNTPYGPPPYIRLQISQPILKFLWEIKTSFVVSRMNTPRLEIASAWCIQLLRFEG